jgi:hypothetical protein
LSTARERRTGPAPPKVKWGRGRKVVKILFFFEKETYKNSKQNKKKNKFKNEKKNKIYITFITTFLVLKRNNV